MKEVSPADKELNRKAKQACQDYRQLYGVYPEKIGIHQERLQERFRTFPRTITFPEMPELPSVFSQVELAKVLPETNIKLHTIPFEPVMGPNISRDEVYLPAHDDETKIISSKELSRLLAARDASQGRG